MLSKLEKNIKKNEKEKNQNYFPNRVVVMKISFKYSLDNLKTRTYNLKKKFCDKINDKLILYQSDF